MVGPHKLLDHLQGMRRYLLLGQGDFVSIFIENMKYVKEQISKIIQFLNLFDFAGMSWRRLVPKYTHMISLPCWMPLCAVQTPSTTIQTY